MHTTPVNQGLASLTSPLDGDAVRLPSPHTENSVADIYEGEGLVNKSIGTPGIYINIILYTVVRLSEYFGFRTLWRMSF